MDNLDAKEYMILIVKVFLQQHPEFSFKYLLDYCIYDNSTVHILEYTHPDGKVSDDLQFEMYEFIDRKFVKKFPYQGVCIISPDDEIKVWDMSEAEIIK